MEVEYDNLTSRAINLKGIDLLDMALFFGFALILPVISKFFWGASAIRVFLMPGVPVICYLIFFKIGKRKGYLRQKIKALGDSKFYYVGGQSRRLNADHEKIVGRWKI